MVKHSMVTFSVTLKENNVKANNSLNYANYNNVRRSVRYCSGKKHASIKYCSVVVIYCSGKKHARDNDNIWNG